MNWEDAEIEMFIRMHPDGEIIRKKIEELKKKIRELEESVPVCRYCDCFV